MPRLAFLTIPFLAIAPVACHGAQPNPSQTIVQAVAEFRQAGQLQGR